MSALKINLMPVGPIKVLDTIFIYSRGIPYAKEADLKPRGQSISEWKPMTVSIGHQFAPSSVMTGLAMGPLTKGHSQSENCLHPSRTAPKDAFKAVMV